MITINKIFCPVDFFPASDAALNYATGLALNYGAKLHLLHVVAPMLRGAYEFEMGAVDVVKAAEENAVLEMKKREMTIYNAGVSVDMEIRLGDVYGEIERAIKIVRPELIVMGTHGRHGVERWFMGSTTEKLLRHTPVPLVAISDVAEKPISSAQFRRILVATDFSAGSADALAYAFSVAEENESRITLLHVLPHFAEDLNGRYREDVVHGVQNKLNDFVPAEARTWCDVITRVEAGVPYQIILDMIRDEQIDLLVMNIHGKGMIDRVLIGSNAEPVVRAAACPVMLIPPLTKFKKRALRKATAAAV
jgi:nucleotide-binding universal stress UspA family protein